MQNISQTHDATCVQDEKAFVFGMDFQLSLNFRIEPLGYTLDFGNSIINCSGTKGTNDLSYLALGSVGGH